MPAMSRRSRARQTPCTSASSSDGKVLLNDLVIERLDGAVRHRSTALHGVEMAGKAPHEGELLLHQQDGQLLLARELAEHVGDLLHDVRLNALGRLVQDQQLG